jgi:hypothetical protein
VFFERQGLEILPRLGPELLDSNSPPALTFQVAGTTQVFACLLWWDWGLNSGLPA